MRKRRVAVDMRAAQQDDPDRSRYAIELAHGLRRRRVELVLILEAGKDRPAGVGELLGLRARIHELDAPIGSVREQLRWPRLLRETGCDVLLEPDHAATPWSSPVPVVTIMHGAVYEENAKLAPTLLTVIAQRITTRIALRRSRIVLTTSEATRVALNRHYHANIDRKDVIRPGAWNSQNAFPSLTAQRRIVAEAIHLPRRYLIHVGARRPAKGQATLLAAFARVASADPDVSLLIVGPRDPRHRDSLRRAAKRLSLGHRVRILDSLADPTLHVIYQMATAFVLPSIDDESPTSMLQAMALGTPVIVSDIPILRELVAGASVLVPAGNAAALASAIQEVLGSDELRARLSRRARAVGASRDWEETAKRVMRAINKLPMETVVPAYRLPRPSRAPRSRAGLAALLGRQPPSASEPGGPPVPAIGPAPPMNDRERRFRRIMLSVLVVLGLVGFGARFAQAPVSERLPTIAHAAWVVPNVAIRSAQPQDVDLVNIRDTYDVGAVVNLRSGGVVESVVAADLGLDYISLTLPDRGAPTEEQLSDLIHFLVAHAERREVVLIHDETGLDRAPAVAVMVDMLRGTPTGEAVRSATGGQAGVLSNEQIAAINELATSLGFSPHLPDDYQPPRRPQDRYGDVSDLVW